MTFTLPEPPAATWPESLPQHLSPSQLSMFERCPEQYRHRYVLGEKEAPSGAMLWGTVDGKAHALNFDQKIETHQDLPVEEVREAFAGLLDWEIDRSGGPSEIDWRDDTPASIKDRGAALVGHYHRTVSPRIQPTATEEAFSLDIPGVPVPFIGYIDVSTEAYTVERKTAKGSAKAIPPHYVLQTLGYALARQRPVELHISTKTIKPAVYTPAEEAGLLMPFTATTVARAERIVAARARQIMALYDTFGPDQEWPDAIGTQAWHTAVCDMCGYGPNGADRCNWWK